MKVFKIMFVEDNINNVKAREAIIKGIKGCECSFYLTGEDALKGLLENDFNLILMDLNLPDINGYELIKIIKNKKFTSHIPVIFVTGVYMTEADKKRGYELGAVDYIFKPCTEIELTNKIFQYRNSYYEIQELMEELIKKNVDLKKQNQILRKNYYEIEFLNFHDNLTQLYSRNYFKTFINGIDIEKRLPFALMVIDINKLKVINDVFGHKKGDEVIVSTAKFLTETFEKHGVIFRWEGDEFLVFMPNVKNELAKKIYLGIIDFVNIPAKGFEISLSAGLSFINDKKEADNIVKLIEITENKMYRNKLLNVNSNRGCFLETLKESLFEKDFETKMHTERVKNILLVVAKKMNLKADIVDEITLIALLHDIGKLAIPEEILMKKEKLTNDEWELIKQHPEKGYNICITIPELRSVAEKILAHHERFDGKGYPKGLKGDEIPLLSRMLSIADSYDVMVSGRPYQKAKTHKEAIDEIIRCKGTQFDPELVEWFISIML